MSALKNFGGLRHFVAFNPINDDLSMGCTKCGIVGHKVAAYARRK